MSARFTISRTSLSQALARIVDTAPLRSPKPVLSNVKVSVNGAVQLVANDLERYHVETLGDDANERRGEIDVLVNARALRKVLTGCKAKQVIVNIEPDSIQIGNTTLEAHLEGISPEYDFPGSQETSYSADASVTLPGEDLARLIERTSFACDVESSRYALGALLVEMDSDGYLRLVGTDGKRLATDYVGQHSGELVKGLWPVSFAKKALKAIRKAETCTLAIVNGSSPRIDLICYGKTGSTAWQFRQIEGRFPKWRDVIREQTDACIVDAGDLQRLCEESIAAAKAANVDNDTCARNSVDVCCGGDVLSVSAVHAKCFCHCDVASQATTLESRLDARYLAEFAKACKGAVLTISAFNKALETKHDKQADMQVRIECGNADYIVMPIVMPLEA